MRILLCCPDESLYQEVKHHFTNGDYVEIVSSFSVCCSALTGRQFDIVLYQLDDYGVREKKLFDLLAIFKEHKIVAVYQDRSVSASDQKPSDQKNSCNDLSDVREYIDKGLKGIIMQSEIAQRFFAMNEIVLFGGIYVSHEIRRRLENRFLMRDDSANAPKSLRKIVVKKTTDPRHALKIYALTPRQQEIIQYIFEGFSNRQIATCLNIREGTVKVHLRAIFKKLCITNRTQILSNFDRVQQAERVC